MMTPTVPTSAWLSAFFDPNFVVRASRPAHPSMGLDWAPTVVALVLYSLLPILRNTAGGRRSDMANRPKTASVAELGRVLAGDDFYSDAPQP